MQTLNKVSISKTAEESIIIESKSIRDVLKKCNFNSFVVFDLDNTVIESTLEIGSDQWVDQLIIKAMGLIHDDSEAVRLVLEISYAIQHIIKIKLVENDAVHVIKLLQDIGIPVVALTSRSTCISDDTRQQLDNVGVHFNREWGSCSFELDIENNDRAPFFRDGIIFCSGNDKGKCFAAFLKKTNIQPQDVLMVDDKQKYLNCVKEVITKTGVHFEGIRYGYLDDKVAHVDMTKAQNELALVSSILPFSAQLALQKLKLKPDLSAARASVLLTNSLFSSNLNKNATSAILEREQFHKQSYSK